MYPIFRLWNCPILVLLDMEQSQVNNECRVLKRKSAFLDWSLVNERAHNNRKPP